MFITTVYGYTHIIKHSCIDYLKQFKIRNRNKNKKIKKRNKNPIENLISGNFLAVQWLGLHPFTTGAWVQPQFEELRCASYVVRPKKEGKKKESDPLDTSMKMVFLH